MTRLERCIVYLLSALGGALLSVSPAAADDTEIFLVNPDRANPPKPNVLFIVDTSLSMDTTVATTDPYDSTVSYAGSCDSNAIYWSDVDIVPDCSLSNNFVDKSTFYCASAAAQLDAIGSYTNTMIQYRGGDQNGNGTGAARWQTLASGYNNAPVECQADSGIHGDGRNAHLWAAGGTDLSDPFTKQSEEEVSWGSAPRNVGYSVYDGNYLNWKARANDTTRSLIDITREVTKSLLGSVSNMNVGLMRFNSEDGGAVILGMTDIDANRSDVLAAIDSLLLAPFSPITETMYESALYWRGDEAYFGNRAGSFPTDPAALLSTSPEVYRQPTIDACSKNYAVLISDGDIQGSGDEEATALAESLPGFSQILGRTSCTAIDADGDGQADPSSCLDDIAEYLSKIDLDPVAPGTQNVVTHTVGFNIANSALLEETAEKSGGRYFDANDVDSLTATLHDIAGNIGDRGVAFAAPAVPVNSFNRTQNLNELYFGVFSPRNRVRWPGNLKRYALFNDKIVDSRGIPAVDETTGFFADTSRSFWSFSVDGGNAELGGAANRMLDPSTRNVYTNISGNALTAAANALSPSNASAFSAADLGLTGAEGEPSKEDLIRWARGDDIDSKDTATVTARRSMGDPLHSQPAAVMYGRTAFGSKVIVFVGTNDGYLHAIDGQSGVELWAFIPEEFLPGTARRYFDPASRYKHYGIDGDIVPVVKDVDNDGNIEPADGDFVYLLFGARRGSSRFYALDVTDENAPEVLWTAEYPEFGESWSTPTIAKIDISGVSQNADNAVVIIGGGYDTAHDTGAYDLTPDAVGTGIHMLDLATGARLWRAGSDASADLSLSAMTRAIPTSISAVDLNGDTFTDRMYASDLGGQVWRFDIDSGATRSSLVAGGVIARLGAEGTADATPADTRRFYTAPDIALITDSTQQRRFIAINIGSGYRAHPFDLSASDQFYSLRDGAVFNALTQDQYNNYDIITVSDLAEVRGSAQTTITQYDRGWKFTLPADEKVIVDSLTFNNEVYFVSYSPNSSPASSCSTGLGRNTLYRMSVINGDPVVPNRETDADTSSNNDRVFSTSQGGIAPSPMFIFPPATPGCSGSHCVQPPVICVGMSCFDPGQINNPVRTLWTQDGIE